MLLCNFSIVKQFTPCSLDFSCTSLPKNVHNPHLTTHGAPTTAPVAPIAAQVNHAPENNVK